MNYKGNKCISCGEEFLDKDDIVVCPECGTPYHRECYKKEGKCINDVLHKNKEVWKPEIKKEDHTDNVVCGKCGTKNRSSSRYCENCAESLNISDKSKNIKENITLEKNNGYPDGIHDMNELLHRSICESMNIRDEEIDGVKLYEMAYFVHTNIPYYLSAFKKFHATGKKISFNLLCMLAPYYYFANRKMYLWALISFLVVTAFSVPSYMSIIVDNHLITGISADFFNSSIFIAISNVCKFLQIAFQIIMAMYANWIYSRHIIRSVKQIKNSFPEKEWMYNILKTGGTNMWALFAVLLIEIFVVIVLEMILGAVIIFISAYF